MYHRSSGFCPVVAVAEGLRLWGCKRLANLVDCKSDVWAVTQEVSENAHAWAVGSSILLAKPWLIFVTFLWRLDH